MVLHGPTVWRARGLPSPHNVRRMPEDAWRSGTRAGAALARAGNQLLVAAGKLLP